MVSGGVGRKNDQLRTANPVVERGLVPSTLKYLRSDSLYVCTGEAVRYSCQTFRKWRHNVYPPGTALFVFFVELSFNLVAFKATGTGIHEMIRFWQKTFWDMI
jgi:hypothetical protein